MHAKLFSIQIFQYFRHIPPRVCTLVLFIITVTVENNYGLASTILPLKYYARSQLNLRRLALGLGLGLELRLGLGLWLHSRARARAWRCVYV